ncbi:MAG: hypothetical protein N4A33_05880 [Bacteriovoracaceae bacterium]|nr:hypothetical protein [Bacteriovoracaceae bacterium]
MKKLLIGLLALGSISGFASSGIINCELVSSNKVPGYSQYERIPSVIILNLNVQASRCGGQVVNHIKMNVNYTDTPHLNEVEQPLLNKIKNSRYYDALVKKWDSKELVIKRKLEFSKRVHTYNLPEKTLEYQVFEERFPYGPKTRLIQTLKYNCN